MGLSYSVCTLVVYLHYHNLVPATFLLKVPGCTVLSESCYQDLVSPSRMSQLGKVAKGCDMCCVQVLEGFSGWRRRWTIVVLCFVAFMLCNMDRVNMSVAILPMSQQYNWNSATVGLVQSSFFW